jgi:hypothetical protein
MKWIVGGLVVLALIGAATEHSPAPRSARAQGARPEGSGFSSSACVTAGPSASAWTESGLGAYDAARIEEKCGVCSGSPMCRAEEVLWACRGSRVRISFSRSRARICGAFPSSGGGF